MTIHPLIEALRADISSTVAGTTRPDLWDAIDVMKAQNILAIIDSRIGKVLALGDQMRKCSHMTIPLHRHYATMTELYEAYDAAVRDGQGRVG